MQAVLSISWDIALWRRSPRDLPASPVLLLSVLCPYVLLGVAEESLIDRGAHALACSLADAAVIALAFAACLVARRRGYRLLQTLTAAFGASSLVALPVLAVLVLCQWIGRGQPLALALQFCLLPLQVWSLLVLARILRLAIDSSLLAGMAFALGCALASDLVQVALPRALAG